MSEKPSEKSNDRPQETTAEKVNNLLGDVHCEIRVIDIREDGELVVGYIDGALLVPNSILEMVIEDLLPDKGVSVILYCASGIRPP